MCLQSLHVISGCIMHPVDVRELAEKQQWAQGKGAGYSCPLHSSKPLGQIRDASKQEILILLGVAAMPSQPLKFHAPGLQRRRHCGRRKARAGETS